MTQHAYTTATAFRAALEERLKNHSRKTGIDLQRLRRQVAFDRFLNRLFLHFAGDLLLKGGYAMELRLEHARATKDIDLIINASAVGDRENQDRVIQQKLQDAVVKNVDDFFEFLIGVPTMDLEAVPYGGSRYPIEALLDGRLFVRFPIDVVLSSLFIKPIETIKSHAWLDFAGIEQVPFPIISQEQQFAEKLHAYTLPQVERVNSRVKDVVDMVFLIRTGKIDKEKLKLAIQKTFEYRASHTMPETLPQPPSGWEPQFRRLATECGMDLHLDEAITEISGFVKTKDS